MPGILKLAQLVQHYRVAKMQIRRRRIHAELDAQLLARGELRAQLLLANKIHRAAAKQRQLLIQNHKTSGKKA